MNPTTDRYYRMQGARGDAKSWSATLDEMQQKLNRTNLPFNARDTQAMLNRALSAARGEASVIEASCVRALAEAEHDVLLAQAKQHAPKEDKA